MRTADLSPAHRGNFNPARSSPAGADPGDRLSLVAHELRTPLAAILYAAASVTAGSAHADVRQAAEVIGRQARRAAELVDDLLDAEDCVRGTPALSRRVVSLAEVVAAAVEAVDHLFAGRTLTVGLLPEPLFVFADPGRLGQVLTNLLANAAKFTAPGGHVRLSAEADGGQVVVRVRDDGRGIAPDLLPRVFDLYARGDGSGGFGIGLAVVRALVEMHGGRVTAHSDGAGRGAEFVVRLPAVPDPVEVASEASFPASDPPAWTGITGACGTVRPACPVRPAVRP